VTLTGAQVSGQWALSGTKRCKYHGVRGSADDAVSERDSDDPGSTHSQRTGHSAKCTTKVGRKELRSGLEGNAPVKRLGSALKVKTTVIEHLSLQRPPYNKGKNRPAISPPSGGEQRNES